MSNEHPSSNGLTQRDLYKPENVVAFLRSIESNSIAGMQYRRAADEIERLQKICAAAYQLAGMVGAPTRFLDALALHDDVDVEELIHVAEVERLKSSQPPSESALELGMQRIMERLTDLLDDDQFNNIEAIALEAGVRYPSTKTAVQCDPPCPVEICIEMTKQGMCAHETSGDTK